VHVGWNSRQLLVASSSSSEKTVSLYGWRSILPFDRRLAIFHHSLVRLIDRPGRYCGCKVQQVEHVLDRAEFKDTIQLRQLKYVLDLIDDIHQLKPSRVRISPPPQTQQDTQPTGVDAVNLRQVKYQCPSVCLSKHRVAQDRVGIPEYNSPLTP